jgi:hypothetical protein
VQIKFLSKRTFYYHHYIHNLRFIPVCLRTFVSYMFVYLAMKWQTSVASIFLSFCQSFYDNFNFDYCSSFITSFLLFVTT